MSYGELPKQPFERASNEKDHGRWRVGAQTSIDLVETSVDDVLRGQFARQCDDADIAEVHVENGQSLWRRSILLRRVEEGRELVVGLLLERGDRFVVRQLVDASEQVEV